MRFLRCLAAALFVLPIFGVPVCAQGSPGETIIVNKFQRLPSAGQINTPFGKLVQDIQTGLPNLRISPKDFVSITTKDLEHLAAGNVKMMLTQGTYYSNTELAFFLLNSPPFISAEEFLDWRQSPEGDKLAAAVYAKHGVKSIPCAVIDANMDFVTRRPLGDEYTLKGAKIALAGPLGGLYAATGMTAMALPFTEIRAMLEKGLVDGAYSWTPHESIEMQLYESAQALYAPSTVRSFFVADLLITLTFWNGLTRIDQAAIASACTRQTTETLATSRKLAAQAIEKYRAGGILVAPLPTDAVEAIRKKWDEVAAKRSVFDGHFQAIYKSLYRK